MDKAMANLPHDNSIVDTLLSTWHYKTGSSEV